MSSSLSSSASIPLAQGGSLSAAPLSTTWSRLVPWLLLLALGAVVGGVAWSVEVVPVVVGASLVAGMAGARVLVGRRRRVRLLRDRVVEEGLVGTTVVKLAEITSIKAGGVLSSSASSSTSPALSPDRLSFAGPGGVIAFADLEPAGALAMARSILAVVGPRLVQGMVAQLGRGESVGFGHRLRADRAGLTVDQQTLAWDEIERVDATPLGVRIFAVDRPDKVLTVPLSTDNVVLLDPLVRALQDGPPQARGAVDVVGWEAKHAVGGELVCGVDKTWSRGWLVFSALVLASAAVLPSLDSYLAGLVVMFQLAGLGTAAISLAVRRRRAFAVYEGGAAGSAGFVAWSDVAHIERTIVDQYANGAYVGRNVTLVLRSTSGKKLRLSGTGDRIEAIAAAAVRRVLPVLVERARRTLAAGGSLQAGPIVVDDRGLHRKHGRKQVFLAWADVDAAVVEGGALHLWRKGDEKSVIALSLDRKDALVVLELCGERLHNHQRGLRGGLRRTGTRREQQADDDAAALMSGSEATRSLFTVDEQVNANIDANVDAGLTPRR